MTAKRTLKRDTLKALERAAMRWWSWQEQNYPGYVGQIKEYVALRRACAAHAAQSQAGGKRRRK